MLRKWSYELSNCNVCDKDSKPIRILSRRSGAKRSSCEDSFLSQIMHAVGYL